MSLEIDNQFYQNYIEVFKVGRNKNINNNKYLTKDFYPEYVKSCKSKKKTPS